GVEYTSARVNRISLGAVGPQQIGAMSMLCPSRAFPAFHDLKTGGASLRIAAYPHIEEFFGGRVPAKPAADAPLHGTSVTAWTLGQRVIQLLELRQQT